MKEFFAGLKSEFSHISWPSRREALLTTVLVVIIAIVVGYYLGLLDMAFGWVLRTIIA